jgi:hypothetical protein
VGAAMSDRLEFAKQFRGIANKLESIAAKGSDEWGVVRNRLSSQVGELFGTAVDAGCFHSVRYASGLVERARIEQQGGTDEGSSIFTSLIGPRGANVLGRHGLSNDTPQDLTDAGFCRRLARILEAEHDDANGTGPPQTTAPNDDGSAANEGSQNGRIECGDTYFTDDLCNELHVTPPTLNKYVAEAGVPKTKRGGGGRRYTSDERLRILRAVAMSAQADTAKIAREILAEIESKSKAQK